MKIKKWKKNNPEAFYQWLKDVKLKVLHSDGVYRVFDPIPEQKSIIDNILSSKNNKFLHSMSIICGPRRHGKTVAILIILLFFFFTRKNFNIVLHSATEQSCRRNQYSTLVKIIRHSPLLNKSLPEQDIMQYEMLCRPLGNSIQLASQNFSASFGGKINILFADDLAAYSDLSSFNALQSSLLDSENSLLLIASNVDFSGGVVDLLQQEAKVDPSIYSTHKSYKDLTDYNKNAPQWLDRKKAARIKRTVLEVEFSRDILGRRLSAQNALFPSNIIELCKSSYKVPVSDIQSLAKGRSYKIGLGLDRSKSLFSGKSGDRTVLSTIMKVASLEHGEPEFYILNQQRINPNTSRGIKKAILKDHELYTLDNCVLENYEVADLAPWLTDQKIPHELVSAHDTNQNASFPEFYRIASEGRFHFSAHLNELESEMRTFSYTQRAGGKYSFGHSSKKHHDDTVYSTNWAIFSLRSAVMTLYTLGNIMCTNKSPNRHYCFLFGGPHVLFCSERCDAYLRVEDMFQNFKQHQFDSELTIQEFLTQKVKRVGARISQAV